MKAYDAAMTTIGLGALGILVSYVVWYLNEEGVWIDQYISAGTPIAEVMAIIVLIFIIVGVLLAAMRSR